MLQIIGFGEVVRLEKGLPSQKEMRVLGLDGHEHGVVIPPEVVKQLLDIWIGADKNPPASVQLPKRQAAPSPEPDPEPGVGEVAGTAPQIDPEDFSHPLSDEVAETPKQDFVPPAVSRSLPKPKFLEADDEDGQQI